MRTRGKINEVAINQNNQAPNNQSAIELGDHVIGVTIRNSSASGNNLFVGWNQPANSGNLLQPGESVSYGNQETIYLDGNKLYLAFDSTGSGGVALVSIVTDTQTEC